LLSRAKPSSHGAAPCPSLATVTFSAPANAPQADKWKEHFENLPQRLEKEGVDPHVPWLCNFKLDFRFK
jgi:hypothetical protein